MSSAAFIEDVNAVSIHVDYQLLDAESDCSQDPIVIVDGLTKVS